MLHSLLIPMEAAGEATSAAQTTTSEGNGGGGGSMMLIMMVVIFAIMWFFMIRPQRKKQKAIEAARRAITVGQHVVTIGGLYGQVKDVDEADNALMVEIAKGVVIKVDRNSVNPAVQPAS